MTRLQVVRYASWAAVAIVLVVASVATWSRMGENQVEALPDIPAAEASVTIGGPFSVVDDAGEPVTEAALLGHPSMLFFGFTRCPDVCPTALAEAGVWLDALGDESEDLEVYFVTVDPERDTPERMAEYLSAFHPAITGLSGPADAVYALLDTFRVYYEKLPADESGNYNMQHTASFYLLDDQGQFHSLIGYNDGEDVALERLRTLIVDS